MFKSFEDLMSKLLLCFYLIFCSCSKPIVKNYQDLIADDAVMVLMTNNEKELSELLSSQFKGYLVMGKLFFPFINSDKEILCAITNQSQVYIALPLKKDSSDGALKYFPDWLRNKCELRGDYLFVPIQGDLPALYGGSNFMPKGKALELLVDFERITIDLGSVFHKRSPLWKMLNINKSFRQALSEVILEQGREVLLQASFLSLYLQRDEKLSVMAEVAFKNDSKLAEGMKRMEVFSLPENQYLDKGVRFSTILSLVDCAPFAEFLERIFGTSLKHLGKLKHILPLRMMRNRLIKAGEFSFVGGLDSTDLPGGVEFVFESPGIQKTDIDYLQSLSGEKLLATINDKALFVGRQNSIKLLAEKALFSLYVDFEKDKGIRELFSRAVEGVWVNLKWLINTRVSGNSLKEIVSNLKPLKVDFSTLTLKVYADNSSLKMALEF